MIMHTLTYFFCEYTQTDACIFICIFKTIFQFTLHIFLLHSNYIDIPNGKSIVEYILSHLFDRKLDTFFLLNLFQIIWGEGTHFFHLFAFHFLYFRWRT